MKSRSGQLHTIDAMDPKALPDWLLVIFFAVFWVGFVLFVRGIRRPEVARPSSKVGQVLSLSLVGIWFGIVMTFRWNAFRAPIVYLTVASLLAGFLVARWPFARHPE